MQEDIAIADLLSVMFKQCAAGAALGACECTSRELRSMLADMSQAAIHQHEQLTSIIIRKGWYVVRGADLSLLSDLHAQMGAVLGGYHTAPAGFVTASHALMESGNL